MGTHRLILPELDNSEYYDLFRRSNALTDRRNEINKRLHAIDTKVWLSRKAKRALTTIKPDVESFVKDALKWKYDASNFILKPRLTFPESDDSPLAFLHFIDNLRDEVNRVEAGINLLEDNYNSVGNYIEGQVNFRIAIWSFIIAFLGLIAALIPLFTCK